MKKLLLIVMVAAHFVAFGQKKKKSIPPPPEKITKQKVQKSPYQRIFEDNMMLAFQWRMEVKDSIIANEDRMIYKINLEFQSIKELSSYKKQPDISALKVIYSVQKGAKLDKNLTPRTHYVDFVDYSSIFESVKIVGDNVELTNDETKEKQIFKIFLDKDKKNIIKLQDSKTKKEFFPTEDFYSPTISI